MIAQAILDCAGWLIAASQPNDFWRRSVKRCHVGEINVLRNEREAIYFCTIWDYAKVNGFTLVSQDVDFADMATLYGPPPKVIWLRCGNQPTGAIEDRLRDHAGQIASFEHEITTAVM